MNSAYELTGKYSILIADDDDGHRSALRDVFAPRGFETVLAANGPETIAIVEDRRIDCLLLDVHMPGLSGLDTLRIIRRAETTLPCVFITADKNVQIVRQALALHAFSVLSKPVSCGLVTDTVRQALESVDRSA